MWLQFHKAVNNSLIVVSFILTVNYGMLLLQALFEHWPETHCLPENDKEATKDTGKSVILMLVAISPS